MHGWESAPPPVRAQVERFREGLQQVLGAHLVGLYLHGSLAMGCFTPSRSDVDLIAVAGTQPAPVQLTALAERLLSLSGQPAPLEFHLLSEGDLLCWRFPTPYRFHFSESWRERFAAGALPAQPPADPDLAAHLTILHHRGVVLQGPPIRDLFPTVPKADYLTAIWEHDVMDALRSLSANPVYGVLNACRVLAFAEAGLVTSKAEGAAWALDRVNGRLRPLIARALAVYAGGAAEPEWEREALERFATVMTERIQGSLLG
ncbi:MAG: aminoglycoside adenylyltransferase domain-containing protein [Bacillota bacterium]